MQPELLDRVIISLVPLGSRAPARQACAALRDAACRADRRMYVVCLADAGAGEREHVAAVLVRQHVAAVLRAIRRRSLLEELALDLGSERLALAYLAELGPGGSGVEGQPPSPVEKLTLKGRWPLGTAAASAALGVALRPGGALSCVRTLKWVDEVGAGRFSQLRALPPWLRVSITSCTEHLEGACFSIAMWAQAERGGAHPQQGQQGQQPPAGGAAAPAEAALMGRARALLARLGAAPAQRVGDEQGPATAPRLVSLTLPNLGLCPDLARAAGALPSLQVLSVACDQSSMPAYFIEALALLAHCPALRELRLTGPAGNQHGPPAWAWEVQALLQPGVRCEVDADGGTVAWPTVGEATVEQVQADVQHMVERGGRQRTMLFLNSECPAWNARLLTRP
jgi:hypothetical protein